MLALEMACCGSSVRRLPIISASSVLLALASSCAHLGPECAAHGGPAWLEVRTAHFIVHTDLAEPAATQAAADLELTLAALQRAMRQSVPKPGAPVETVIFRSVDELQVATEQRHVSGMWRADWRGPVITIGGEERLTGDRADLTVMKHELVHFVAAHNLGPQPRWLAEGLGRYFETLTIDPEKRLVRSGQLEVDALDQVRDHGLLPLERLWEWGPPGSESPEFESAAYASSWLWVHLLVNRQRERVKAFFASLRRREEPRAAFAAAFAGVDPHELLAQAQDFVDRGSYRVSIAPLGTADVSSTVTPLADSAVHALLARVAPPSSVRQQRELTAALALDPENVAALEEQANAEEDPILNLERVRDLTRRHPTAVAFRLLARAMTPAARAERIDALERALALDPRDAFAHGALARVLIANGEAPRSLALSARAVELAPFLVEAWATHAEALAANTRCDEAADAMRRAVELLPHESARAAQAMTRRLAGFERGCSKLSEERGDDEP